MTDKAQTMEARYQRANTLLQGVFTSKLVQNDILFPHWIAQSDCFWYVRALKNGKHYRLVDASIATNEPAFDHHSLARALAEAVERDINEENLPIDNVEIKLSPLQVLFTAFDKRWLFEPDATVFREVDTLPEHWLISPDGRQALFTRDFNLWVRDLNSGEERALSKDGQEDFAYAVEGESFGFPITRRVQACWSPDSRRVFAVQCDNRQVKTMPVLQHVPLDGSMRPKVSHYKIALPSDSHASEYHLLTIEVATGKIQRACYPGIPVLNSGWGYFDIGFGWWATDSRRAYFVDQTRDHRIIKVVEYNTDSGETRVLFTETSTTNLSLAPSTFDYPLLLPLPETGELVWWSERTGWGHLYLYDLETGTLKQVVTQGDWLIREVLQFDAERRELLVQTSGRVAERDPYYKDLCRVHIDSGELTSLVSSDHDYFVATGISIHVREAQFLGFEAGTSAGISPSGDFVIMTRSRADEVSTSLLVDRQGKELLNIETADIANLPPGWQWPEPVKLRAADGKTDIYGLVYRPSDFSPEHSYPILVCGYHAELHPSVPKGSFSNGSWLLGAQYFHAIALAELGFVVMQIDSRGTPYRDKAFMDDSYGHTRIGCNLDDEIAGIRQLATRYPYLDLDRVGIICPLAGPGAVWALLKHPEFYKVGVTGEHYDWRVSSTLSSDKFDGPLEADATYQFPEHLVDNLSGKLLLMSGMLNPGNPVAGTFRLVDALQRANKDFDMLLLPQGHHCAGNYQLRRAWDYLVKHLLGMEPPKEFNLIAEADMSELLLEHDAKAVDRF
ncbi:S9 family peptidase [Porticoccaceae bacterium]|nr:S9 family peptidase [Porticoccaceae bacterium]